MPDLPEHSSPKAARILAAAGELLLGRGSKGVTVADVAARAHVGKGTVYLYWKTKEDLLLGLIARDFLALADDAVAEVVADPDLARPSLFCPHVLDTLAEHPFVNALQHHDDELLGILAQDPRAAGLLDTLGPGAMMRSVLPLWRANALARTDWPLDDQATALHALTTGFIVTTAGRPPAATRRVLAAAVTALLGPERATAEQVRATAAQGLDLLAAARFTVLGLIDRPIPA